MLSHNIYKYKYKALPEDPVAELDATKLGSSRMHSHGFLDCRTLPVDSARYQIQNPQQISVQLAGLVEVKELLGTPERKQNLSVVGCRTMSIIKKKKFPLRRKPSV